MFVLSKLLTAVTQPMFWVLLWWVAALVLLQRRGSLARKMLWSGLVTAVLLGFGAGPDAMLRALERQHSVPVESRLAGHKGLIVLGGAIAHPDSYQTHGQVPLGESAERMTVPLAVLRRHAHMELVFSGGEGRLLTTGVTESDLARLFYAEQGLDPGRIRLENGSRTTRENALGVAALLGERCRDPWLLVTSAWHMPRAFAEFKAAGCNVTPYPVDFRTAEQTPWTEYSLAYSLVRWQIALHEWLGLAVYAATR